MVAQIENEGTLKAALKRYFNLFLGAGFSALAVGPEGHALPIGNALSRELKDQFQSLLAPGSLDDLTLAQMVTVIGASASDQLDAFLRARFRVETFDAAYAVLTELAPGTIFTTNIDDLVERVFSESTRHYINDIDLLGSSFGERLAVDLLHLHGSVTNPNRHLRFSSTDIAASFQSDPDRWRYLQMKLDQRPTMVWGYAMEDPATLNALAESIRPAGRKEPAWIQLTEQTATSSRRTFLGALGFRLIVADTAELLAYLGQLIDERHDDTLTDSPARIREALQSELIPAITAAPVRPIVSFFRGNAPTWGDIYSGLVPRLSHHRTLEDLVYSGKNVVLTGIPACGKTTLLMQVAASIVTNTIKLYVRQLTTAKAAWILRVLADQSAVVFVDNFSDDAEAAGVLMRASNVQVIASDRDFLVSRVMNMIDDARLQILDATPLSPPDVQALWNAIPASLRRPAFRMPRMSSGGSPSIFEIIEANSSIELRTRFRAVLDQLVESDPPVAEALILTAYLHSCRTPLPFDVALAYWGSEFPDYRDVYRLLEDAGELITEAEEYGERSGPWTDYEQDYFTTRSQIVAEAVLRAAKGSQLRTVLLRFHRDVSLIRVPRSNVFLRSAFDYHLFVRAFQDVTEGAGVYDELFKKYDNFYVLQHKALYLAATGKREWFHQAFVEIDRAQALSGGRNLTIRNTHAEIMFRTNIAFASLENQDVRVSLDSSLRTLEECFNRDRRKAVHATVYGNNALQYWSAYGDARARRVLETAAAQLQVAARREPWLDGVRRLQLQIDRKLRDSA